MTDHDPDPERMAALFVSDEGEIRCEPDWEEEGLPTPLLDLWERLSVLEPVAAGILRLIRERDEALTALAAEKASAP